MENFLIGLPSILGALVFIIYLLLKKSVIEDPVIKNVLDKLRTNAPETYEKFKGLSNIEREKLLKSDVVLKRLFSLEEFKLLDKVIKGQFWTNIFVYSLVAILLITGICLFIFQSSRPKALFIDNIRIQNNDTTQTKILVDLDPIIITWTYTGRDEELDAVLENVETGQQTKKIKVQASEGRVVFERDPYDNYDKILSRRNPFETNRIRAVFYGKSETFKSKEFQVKVGVQLYVLATLPNEIEIFATIDRKEIDNYIYLPKLVLYEGESYNHPVFFEAHEYLPRHTFKVPHPERVSVSHYILSYNNQQDDRIVRTEIDLAEFLKLH